jgi:hypothetical protein
VFLKGLFPEPPSSAPIQWNGYLPSRTYDWPEITRVEIKRAIFSSSIKITPGSDRLSYRILREAYTAVPELFDFLYPILIGNGYHPKCWKEATGVILQKPQNTKPPYRDFALPKAYRVISLLNCLGKVAEKIVAKRLATIAEIKTVLHPYQIGGRK